MLSYRNSWKQLSESSSDTAIISVGSTEQCGPCLPLHLDTLVAEYFAHAWGELLEAYVLPTLPFNTAEEHSSFRGTITLRPETVMAVLGEIVADLREYGFRKQVLTVGHGGSYWRAPFLKDINRRFSDIVLLDAHQGGDAVWEEALERAGLGGRNELHGGAQSRALALFLAPDCVLEGDFGRAVPGPMTQYADYVTWDRITTDGSWGKYSSADALIATADAGRRLLEHFVRVQGLRLKTRLAEAARLKRI